MYYIYIIENKQSGKYYVGQTRRFQIRWMEHKTELKHKRHKNEHLQNSYNKYGAEVFDYYLLDSSENKSLIDQLEKDLIAWFKELDLSYNIQKGGEGGNHSDETKEKMRQNMLNDPNLEERLTKLQAGREKHYQEFGHPNKNVPMSEEQKKKISEAKLEWFKENEHPNKGKSFSPEVIAKRIEAITGKPSPHKGKTNRYTEESLEKMRSSHLGHKPSEETRQKMREARAKQIMQPRSEETKRKLKEAHTGKKLTEEHKEKISKALKLSKNT